MIPVIWWIRIAALAAVVGVVLWFSHARYSAGETAGRAHVQAKWDAAVETERKAIAAADAARIKKEAADRKAAEEISHAYIERISSADALARDTARRLHDAQARAGRCAVPRTAASSGGVAPSGGESGDATALDRADEDHHAACARDAATVNAWFDWCEAVQCWATVSD